MAVAIMGDIIQKDPILSKMNIVLCSAGTGAIGGQGAHPYAQETMKEWGLNLDNHISSPLTGDIVDKADLLVALDKYVEEEITGYYHTPSRKICTLNIPDPYRFLLEAYQQCAQDIRDSCIKKVLPFLSSSYRID